MLQVGVDMKFDELHSDKNIFELEIFKKTTYNVYTIILTI